MARTFRKLNRTDTRKLEAGQSLTEHGITFERMSDGDGRYSVNVMVDGERIHRVIGRESEKVTRSQAERFIEQVRTDARHGRLKLPKGRKTAFSFRKAADKYIEKLKAGGGRDLSAKKRKLELHLSSFFGDRPLDKIETLDIERYKKHRLGQRATSSAIRNRAPTFKDAKVTPATVNRELAVLSHLFTKAVEWGWIPHRPARIVRLRENNSRIIYLTVEQINKLIECAEQDANPQIHPFILVGLATSMRLSEILAIQKQHVDISNLRIFIPRAKAGAREQPITGGLASYLERYMDQLGEDCNWLFPSRKSKRGHTVNINKPFQRVVKAAGLNPKEVVRHTLRHTAITHLVQAGVDLPTVKRISGHRTLQMVERYAHANGEHIRAAMDMLEKRLRTGS